MQQAKSNTPITFSFVLGNTKEVAIKTLAEVKDAMAGALIVNLEDDLALNEDTLQYAKSFYMAADIQHRHLLQGK